MTSTTDKFRKIVEREQNSWPRRNRTRLQNGKNPFPTRHEIIRFYSK
jgi:hypothetical protein